MIYADESVNVAIVDGLRRRGVAVLSAKELGKLGLSDEQQIKVARENRAVIFTHDADFLRIASQRHHHQGINYIHQQKLTLGECIRRLKLIVELRFPNEMRDRIVFL